MTTTTPTYHQLLQNDLTSFIGRSLMTANPGADYLPNWHIAVIAEHLEAARRGEIRRLIINMPPRALKSICVSVAWPAWLLGHDARVRVLVASYAMPLALKHSLDCRAVMRSRWYRNLFPEVALAKDQNEKHKFMTTKRGYRYATSVDGSTTGEGGNVLIIDDPQNPAQAESPQAREHVQRWFDHTFASRLDDKKNGVMVLVMQRLHADDLSGYLLAKGGWEHLCLPAIAVKDEVFDLKTIKVFRKPGQYLHPEREGEAEIARARTELGSTAFAAQYQQNPQSTDGVMVKPWWFTRYQQLPLVPERCVQSWDTAIKSASHNDASVCLTFLEHQGKSFLADAACMRLEYPDLKRAFAAQASRWQPHAILVEDKASGQQLLQDMKRESTLPVIACLPKGDKRTRFAATCALMEAGRVVLPRQSPWLSEFEGELFAFPQCPHDDHVDALSQYLDHLRKQGWNRLQVRGV